MDRCSTKGRQVLPGGPRSRQTVDGVEVKKRWIAEQTSPCVRCGWCSKECGNGGVATVAEKPWLTKAGRRQLTILQGTVPTSSGENLSRSLATQPSAVVSKLITVVVWFPFIFILLVAFFSSRVSCFFASFFCFDLIPLLGVLSVAAPSGGRESDPTAPRSTFELFNFVGVVSSLSLLSALLPMNVFDSLFMYVLVHT